MTAGLKCNLRKGDDVIVITGSDKGKRGKIIDVNTKTNRVVVEGVNLVKRHQKATKMGQEAGIITKEATIHASNVMIADPKTGKATRVGAKVLKDGQKVRVAKKSGEQLAN